VGHREWLDLAGGDSGVNADGAPRFCRLDEDNDEVQRGLESSCA
jgi:hypothetical protein